MHKKAGGIILEVGGVLQHGALVAREYGKPCITGIENVTSLLQDGQLIEMDGLTGIIQIIEVITLSLTFQTSCSFMSST